MKILDALEDFTTPALNDLESWRLDLLEILLKRASCDYFCDENYLFLLLVDPSADEADDVRVL